MIQPVTVFCSPASLTFHVYGTSRQSQASVDLQATLFSDYSVSKQHSSDGGQGWHTGGEFCVNLTTVLECLHVLGTQNLERTKLCLSYNITDEIFKMELLEEGILSTAAIPGMLPPDNDGNSLALAFRSAPIVARIIVKSECLREALQELELVHGATCCTVGLGPNGIQLASVGHVGECLISLPSGGSSIVQLDCTQVEARTYALHSIKSGMRGLEIAEETCVSINAAGMIAIQHQVLDTITNGPPSFVDFIMSCLEDMDEDEQSASGLVSQRNSQDSSPSMTMGWDDENGTNGTAGSGVTKHFTVEKDEGNDSEENLPARPASDAPLFGIVATQGSQRAVRRRRGHSANSDRSSTATSALPTRSDDDSDNEMDIAAPISTPSRHRRVEADQEDVPSSPEIVYD